MRFIVILAQPRSGSHALMYALVSNGCGSHHETFYSQFFGESGFPLSLNDLKSFCLRTFNEHVGPNGVFAAKALWQHWNDTCDRANILKERRLPLMVRELFQEDACYVLLRRRDLIAMAVSFHIARESDKFTPEQKEAGDPASILYDYKKISGYVWYFAQSNISWDRAHHYLHASGSPYCCVAHEDLFGEGGPARTTLEFFLSFHAKISVNLGILGMPVGKMDLPIKKEQIARFRAESARDGRIQEIIAKYPYGY